MLRRTKIFVTLAVAAVTLLLLSVTLLPMIVRSQAIKGVTAATGRVTRIEQVTFNPFNLTVTIKGFQLLEADGTDFVAFSSLRLSVSSLSLVKRALIVDEVTLESPVVHFSRSAANTFSFSDILTHIQQQKKGEKDGGGSEFRYSINQITLKDGSIDFNDQDVPGGRRHTVRDLQISLPFISNIPYLVETYTAPQLSAMVNGSPFSFSGQVKPLSKSLETAIRIDLHQLDLPRYLAYSPVPPPVDLTSGMLSIAAEINYRVSAEKKPELTFQGDVQLEKIKVKLRNGDPLLEFAALQLSASRLDLFAKNFAFSRILLDQAGLYARRDQRGAWMIDDLLPPATKNEKVQKETAPASPIVLTIDDLQLRNSSLTLRDDLPAGGFTAILAPINFSAQKFSTVVGASPASYQLNLTLDGKASLQTQGEFALAPLAATAKLELRHLPLQMSWPYQQQFLTAPLQGDLSATAEIAYNRNDGVLLKNGSVQLHDLALRSPAKEGLTLAQLDVEGINFNVAANRAEVDAVRLLGGNLVVSRTDKGTISLLSLLKAGNKSPAVESSPAEEAGEKEVATPFSWALRELKVDNFNVDATDHLQPGRPHFTLKNNFNVQGLSGPRLTPIAVNFNLTINKGTTLRAQGVLTPEPFHYRGDLSLRNLQLRDFADYLPENVHLFVVDGALDAALRLDAGLENGALAGIYQGDCALRSLYLIDTATEDDLLKWQSLHFEKVSGTLAPLRLNIDQIALNDLYARVIVQKDMTLNLTQVVSKAPEPAAPPAAAGSAAPVLPTTGIAVPAPRPQIAVGSITLQNGTFVFTDRHLPEIFNSTIYNLGGRISQLSSEESTLADVDLRGNLENRSLLQITGRINPLKEELFVDLAVSCKDIDLSAATPYSGTYLGYVIEKGKLFLELNYLIDKKELKASNKVFIDQFTFGDTVTSDKATSLPITLAIALLKDRKGEIHLDLPVTGRTDDPQLSIWGVVWKVLTNLIVKAATSPMALLSSMFGSGEDISSVYFPSGQSRLAAAEGEKLKVLAQGLAERPGLKLEIKGYVDRKVDGEGYRQELLLEKLRKEKFLRLTREQERSKITAEEELAILPEELPELLKAVYKKGKFAKPRNAFGFEKDLPEDEMRKLLLANIIVGESELQQLARARAAAVLTDLRNKGGLSAERLFLKNDDIDKAPPKAGESRSRAEFNVIVQ